MIRSPDSILQACRSLLSPEEQSSYYWSVRRVVRLYLRAAQFLLDTVENAEQLVRRLLPRSSRTHFIQHHRQADPVTTTTTEAATTTATTTTASTPSTTMVSTTTEDPFGEDFDAFLSETPAWVREGLEALEAASSTTPPVPLEPPKTVIVLKDAESLSTTVTQETTTTLASATTEDPTAVSPTRKRITLRRQFSLWSNIT